MSVIIRTCHTLSYDSPFVMTLSPTSFPPRSPILAQWNLLGGTLPPGVFKLPLALPEALLLNCFVLQFRSFMTGLFWTHKIAVFLLPSSLFFYILLFSIYHYLTYNVNFFIQFTRISNCFSHWYIPGMECMAHCTYTINMCRIKCQIRSTDEKLGDILMLGLLLENIRKSFKWHLNWD